LIDDSVYRNRRAVSFQRRGGHDFTEIKSRPSLKTVFYQCLRKVPNLDNGAAKGNNARIVTGGRLRLKRLIKRAMILFNLQADYSEKNSFALEQVSDSQRSIERRS